MKYKRTIIFFIICVLLLLTATFFSSACDVEEKEGLLQDIGGSSDGDEGILLILDDDEELPDPNDGEDGLIILDDEIDLPSKENNQSPKSSESDSSSQGKTQNQQNSGIKIKEIVIGHLLNGKIQSVDFLLTDSYYTCAPVLDIPIDGSEKFKWHVMGGSSENADQYHMKWKTPGQGGTFSVWLEITKANGSSDKAGTHVKINSHDAIVEPPSMYPPTIYDIRLYNTSGIDDGVYYTDSIYEIVPMIDGSDEMIEYIDFTVSSGWQWNEDYPVMKWNTPLGPEQCTITVFLYDVYGDIIDSMTIYIDVLIPS